MCKQFSPDRLEAIRRMRKARRLNKTQPLFAFNLLCSIYQDYTYEMFFGRLAQAQQTKEETQRKITIDTLWQIWQDAKNEILICTYW